MVCKKDIHRMKEIVFCHEQRRSDSTIESFDAFFPSNGSNGLPQTSVLGLCDDRRRSRRDVSSCLLKLKTRFQYPNWIRQKRRLKQNRNTDFLDSQNTTVPASMPLRRCCKGDRASDESFCFHECLDRL